MAELAAMPMDSMAANPMMQAPMPEYIGTPEKSYGTAKSKLLDMAKKDNLADGMGEDKLREIGVRVVDDYKIDEESRKAWLERNKKAIELANQVLQEKTFPWVGAANVKLPLIADASIKFAARAFGELVKNNQVVKGEVVGRDKENQKYEQARRVGQYMSWQLIKSLKEWMPDTDKLLHVLPVVGHLFRKLFYDPSLKRVSSQLIMPDKLCINYTASSLETARRITHILDNTHRNTVVSNQRAGIWLDVELHAEPVENEPDTEEYYCFLEQHKYLDLDDDGYEEPYIVTVHKDSNKVVRIVSNYQEQDIVENKSGKIMRITPCQYFADYKFIPSFDGGYYYTGFGMLLAPLNETANTLFNQLLDSGTINNLQSGFLSKDIKVKGGIYRFSTGEWKKTEATSEQLSKGIMPLPTKEPSPTLFNLLGLVMELTKDLASVKDVLAGDAPGLNVPATTIVALIEQGMKTYNAIYKRIYMSEAAEFQILYDLNYRYMDEEEYFRVLDEEKVVYRKDFNKESCDVIPVADPNLSSDVQRMARVQALQSFIGQAGVNPRPIQQYALEALQLDTTMIEEILPEQDPNMNPDVMKLRHDAEMKMAETQLKEREIDIRERELDLRTQETEAKIVNLLSQAVKNFADAEAAEAGQQMQFYQAEVGSLIESIKMGHAQRQQAHAEQQSMLEHQRSLAEMEQNKKMAQQPTEPA